MVGVEEAAPAKINLDLSVLGRRSDGYHELDSLVVFADLADRLRFEASDRLELTVAGPEAGDLPADQTNLVLRAAALMAEAAGRAATLRIRLDKRLPVAAGIGGGSSDAAATLRALNRLWGLAWSPERLAELGRELGADVPVCIAARTARMRGIGERLEPLELPAALPLLLVNPRVGVPTGPVFRALAAPPVGPAPDPPERPLEERLRSGRNDLEAPAIRLQPVIGEVLGAIRTLPGVRLARMSGSGATCFGWFETAGAAADGAAALEARRPDWWIRPVLAGGPA